MSTEDTLAASQAAHEQFDELVEQFEAQPQTTPAEPNQSDLEWLNQMQASIDDSGHRRYETDQKFRERLESARAKVFAGDSIADVRAGTERALAGEPASPPPQEPVPAQGTPGERLVQHLNDGGTIGPSDVNESTWEALTAGYEVNLPQGYVLGGEHVGIFHTAKAAGIPQDVVNRYISEAVKE